MTIVAAAIALAASAASGADTATRTADLQQLGTRIKHAVTQASSGFPTDHGDLEGYRRTLVALIATVADEPLLAAKGASIARQLDQLESLSVRPELVTSAPTGEHPGAGIDRETVSARHGDACATALGLRATTPARVVLAHAGENGAQAWFRLDAGSGGYWRIDTDSQGSDPAIEVFADCAAASVPLAANDDSIGLDAAVALHAPAQTPLFVHVVNSGAAGAVVLSAQQTSATISGKITDASNGVPIQQAQITLFNSSGSYIYPDVYTDANGVYSMPAQVGSYYVRALANQHVGALYPDAQCGYGNYYFTLFNCPSGQAQLVAVADGAQVSGIDLALQTGHRLAGVVHDDAGNALQGNVQLFDGNGNSLAYGYTDPYGRYIFSTLPSASYKILASAPGYGSQWYDHVNCTGALLNQCSFANGSPIVLSDQDSIDVDFNLPALASIQGTVLDTNSQPIPNQNVQVTLLAANGNYVVTAYADAFGHYRVGALQLGTYYAYASSYGYFSQLYDGVDCAASCGSDTAAATPLVIGSNGQMLTADFKLNMLPVVHGHVQDTVTGLPVANVQVYASTNPPATFNWSTSAVTDASGDYILKNTPVGSYYLWAQSVDHVDQIYPSVPCESGSANTPCDVTGAILLQISLGQVPPAFNFMLQPSASISGRAVIDAGSGSDLPASIEIDAFNGAGVLIDSVSTDASGNYSLHDVPPGNVYVAAGANNWYYSDYAGQVWPLLTCVDTCVPTTGTPIVVATSAHVDGIDFRLVARRAIVGRVTDSFGAPIAGALIDLFDSYTTDHLTTGVSDASGFYAATYNFGASYFVASDADGYVDQIYSGVLCPAGPAYFGLCAFTAATTVTIGYQSSMPHIVNFTLTARELIFSNGFE